MKTIQIFGLLAFLTLMVSCDSDDGLTQEQEAQNLSELIADIQELGNSVMCENATQWSFSSYGNKACGGPVGFIAYSLQIDVPLFLKKIEEHSVLQQKYNEKWNIISDCSIVPEPVAVACESGSPVLVY